MKKLNTVIYFLITLLILTILNTVCLSLVDQLFYSESGGSVPVDNYVTIFIGCIVIMAIITTIFVMNIKIFLKKSTMPYYISIPLNTIVFINILLILCFYIFSLMFMWIILIGGWLPIAIVIIVSLIIGIYKENKRLKNS